MLDRLGFEQTAQALNACVVKSTGLNRSPLTTRETVYQDERTRNAELHAQNERLNSENIRLERGVKDAKREISALKQSIESLRVNLLVRPHTPPSAGSQAAFHLAANPPTPNPRGRPRKYPILSPTHTSVFQAPTHSNPGAQLPVSSSSILNTSASLPASTQPPPEKRLRATQPDARAELLLAAARRVGKDRVVEILEGPEGPEIRRLGGASAKADLELELERDENLPQPRAAPAQHESPPATRIDHSNTRRGRPSRTSVSFPSGAHHHFNQFLVEDNGKPDLGRGRGAKMRATKSAQEMSKHAVETAKGGGVFDVRSNAQSHAPRQPQIQTQQVVVAFTGNPQAAAQAYLTSFLAQYPGI
ncbi:hypothetical protein BDV93DRAFT_564398 [Ceratobasidium sp. AG-I]|nr:hypothetical protein BDV93DRAFT_564398 [Ceratobasidium sp. AG-I]